LYYAPTGRPRAHNKTITSLFLGVHAQTGIEMFLVVVDRSSFSSAGSLFHARDAATEKALSPIH